MSDTPDKRNAESSDAPAASAWRALGAFSNNALGARLYQAAGPLVNHVMGRASTPRLSEAPFAPLRKPLRECRVALVTTAGFHLADDQPFDVDALTGDPSYREIPMDADLASLKISHTHYPHRYAQADPNVLLPLDRLRELATEGTFQLAPRCFSFGFAGMLTQELIEDPDGSAHQVARRLREDGVDILLLAPA
jgi:D-proline reductase (dithiol) PrdB